MFIIFANMLHRNIANQELLFQCGLHWQQQLKKTQNEFKCETVTIQQDK